MAKDKLVVLLLVVWAALYAWSFVHFAITEPTGDSFVRGMNRITGFLGWQMAAGAVAIFVFVRSFGFPTRPALRWLCRIPLIAAVLLVLGIVALIGYANFSKPDPDAGSIPDRPVTAPAVKP